MKPYASCCGELHLFCESGLLRMDSFDVILCRLAGFQRGELKAERKGGPFQARS